MTSAHSPSRHIFGRYGLSILLTLIVTAAACFTTACSGGSSAPVLSGNTQVTLLLTGTANDQLAELDLSIQSIALTSQSGKTVALLSALQGTEFIHINGGIEPLVTAAIPQDVYTAATATIGGASFTCVVQLPGILDTSTFSYGQTPQANITVNLPAPITVTGNNMALSLNLLVAQSATFSACYDPNGNYTYSITPTFNLTPVALSSQPTNAENGKVTGFNGQVSSIDAVASSIMLSLPELENTRTIAVSSADGTVYQGIVNFSGLAVGTFINLDGAIQPDGALLSTRIAAVDTSATSLVTGPLVFVSNAEPAILSLGRQEQGALFAGAYLLGSDAYSFGNAAFLISGQLSNLQDLPFTPSFTGSNMVPGQNVYLSTSSLMNSGGFPYTPLTTVMLIPQTIDGTVTGTSTSGKFTVYTVELASYDMFPNLAVQPGQANLLTNPSEVEVYVDSNTQQLESQALAPGSTFRFYGLVFNDNGTLRMDCAQVNDGVSVTPHPNAVQQNRMVKGEVRMVRAGNLGTLHQMYRLITPVQ